MTNVINLTPKIETKQLERNDFDQKISLFSKVFYHPLFRPYFRLAFLMIVLNAYIFLNADQTAAQVQNLILLNFGVGIFIRQQWVINLLFKMATSAPKSWPIKVRWALGKVYHFGGIHIGGYIAGTFWLGYFLTQSMNQGLTSLNVLLAVHLLVLMAVMIVSLPQIRFPKHNLFEIVARFGNWTSILLFWAECFVQEGAIFSANKVVLSYLTFCVALPWFRLKRVHVEINSPSDHAALAKFDHGETPFAGSSTELSTNPLFEWHSFANIPVPGEKGFRLTISRAGDWTGRLIDQKPKKLWVKGITTAGVGNVELLFKKVVWVATGSGIGPCLPHLLDVKVPSKLVWSTRDPRKTYGDELVDKIMDSNPDALIWDTTANGKPDLVKLAYHAFKEFEAEAVIVISNQKVTFHVNYELEQRGIPAFGAIWDS
ncbi:MAG: hypothetical protein COW01_03975 [Bdellovibrionales bacterium CG12_big_fil_rev_8_21_14_0_65_38_15]|nr:MAG: hypothetical protein COW79_12960 [Bdellovibrionales bacterium CG22_combo_CG10-13_8_21_14_all_38_13]PIQ56621.1 MAG: hypothetical protein COW01_03975 [Bdellovibrionales bacterium CG12_big_fil_rev_8_21_14_0_65_38_15]PIR31262.1 MAG: hypothetical protein COV38_01515 [Bdellovibrionales bacterium CG11_big_fil_rev_8_21_14_0_20_38_13]